MSAIRPVQRANRSVAPRAALVIGMLTVVGVCLMGCTPTESEGGTPTRVLQSAAINVESDGAISAINGSAISFNEDSGTSDGSTSTYVPAEVIADLPVRITTHYRTETTAGSDLADVVGYTGRVEIGLTVENLTVSPRSINYDVAGQSHTTPALVGTPLSVAGSAKLSGTAANNLVFGREEGNNTNGVVSADPDGNAIIQWATLLAPPQTAAAATFLFTADVQKFSVPEFDVAVQAGFHTELSYQSVVASAFDTSPTSARGVQQRAISLVAEVNGVLNRAGATLAEVRKNLTETSATLGVSATRQLKDSAVSLTSEIHNVGNGLATLQTDLADAVTKNRVALSSQLSQTVTAMATLMGETTGMPRYQLDGEGCATQVVSSASKGTLFAVLLQLSGLLDGYAVSNDACRNQVVSEISRLLGPIEPSPENCASASLTCAIHETKKSVADELGRFVNAGNEIIQRLNLDTVATAQGAHRELGATLEMIGKPVEAWGNSAVGAFPWDELDAALADAVERIDELESLRSIASTAVTELRGDDHSVQQQQKSIADQICALADQSAVPFDRSLVEQIRAQIVDTRCDGSALDPAGEAIAGTLQHRLERQTALWQRVASATEPESSALASLRVDLGRLSDKLSALRSAAGADTATDQTLLAELTLIREDALSKHNELGTLLTAIQEDQGKVKATLGGELSRAAEAADRRVAHKTDGEIETVIQRFGAARQSLVDGYTAMTTGLVTTAEQIRATGKEDIDEQRAKLESATAHASTPLDERSIRALDEIGAATSATTRDTEASARMLSDSLNKVMLDLGDPTVPGAGILGAMSASGL
jgi:hypothetical protein